MKPTISKFKNVKGRIVGYRARFGPIDAQGATPNEAVEQCAKAVQDALERLERGASIGQWRGHTYVVSPDANGWRAWCDVYSRTDYYTGSGQTREDAEDGVLSHLAASLWTHDVVDDEAFVDGLPQSIKKELVDRFKWYREYKRLADKGYNDSDARAIIGGFKKEDA
jgi:hypothetical protein